MNEAQALTLKAGKAYKTESGHKVVCVGSSYGDPSDFIMQFPGGGPFHAALFKIEPQSEGRTWCFWCEERIEVDKALLRIVSEWVEPERVKGWIAVKSADFGKNIYLDTHIHPSAEIARTCGTNVIAVLPLDVLEGHGLNGEAA